MLDGARRLWVTVSTDKTPRSADYRPDCASGFIVLVDRSGPRIVAEGDKDWWTGLQATVWYSIGTVPTQLAISLVLAVMLFQNIRGRALFRMIFFIPYIAPFVGTAAVFRIIFSARPTSLLNSLMTTLGFSALPWLNEPRGVFQLLFGDALTLPG